MRNGDILKEPLMMCFTCGQEEEMSETEILERQGFVMPTVDEEMKMRRRWYFLWDLDFLRKLGRRRWFLDYSPKAFRLLRQTT